MIEETAQPAGVVTTEFKGFPHVMGRVAFALHAGDGGFHPVSYSWILGHFASPMMIVYFEVK
jgi:hypothetical protein